MLGAYAPLGSSAPSHTPTAASLLHCSAVRPRRCGQHVDATFSTPPWSTEAAETTSSAPSGWMRMACFLRSGATARRHSHPGWLGWTLKNGCGWWQLEEGDRTGRASQGKERPRHTLRKARVPWLRQPRVEQHAIQLGTNRRFLSTAHILLSSCVFAASARPPHTSVVMQLRVRRPVWSPTGPARRAASGAPVSYTHLTLPTKA